VDKPDDVKFHHLLIKGQSIKGGFKNEEFSGRVAEHRFRFLDFR